MLQTQYHRVLLVGFGRLGVLHAQLEGETGERFPRRVIAKPRLSLFGDPTSGLYPRPALRGPLERVPMLLHRAILAQAAERPGMVDQNFVLLRKFAFPQTNGDCIPGKPSYHRC